MELREPLPPHTPLKRSTDQPGTVEPFDMIAALRGAGVPHITEQILCYLDSRSLLMSELVSTLWRDVIEELSIWKHLLKQDLKNSPLWRGLFDRRGWHKYLEVPLSKQIPSHFYRHLHQSAHRDFQSLEANWRRGHYTLTRAKVGSRVLCLHYDDKKIVTGQIDRTIQIWDRSTLQLLKVLKGHEGSVDCLQCNEEVIISGSLDHTVKVWDIQTGQVINNLLQHTDEVRSLKFTTDTLVTSGLNDLTVVVWNINSPIDITLRMILRHKGTVLSVELNETHVFSGSGERTIKVWDIFTGELVQTLRGHSNWIRCLQLQGSHLISGDADGTIRIWNIDTGECIRVLHGHEWKVSCVAVDNKRILSGSFDMIIKVWDLAAALDTGSSSDTLCITTLKEHTSWIRAVQFDAFQVISGADDETLLTYDFLDSTPPFLRT